jgi:hypothetical protein
MIKWGIGLIVLGLILFAGVPFAAALLGIGFVAAIAQIASPLIFFVGIVLLIIGATRSRKRS